MFNKIILFFSLAAIIGCGQKKMNPASADLSSDLKSLFDQYYEERLKFYPMEATQINDSRYNDTLPVDISEAYREKLRGFYKTYLEKITKYDRALLNDQEKISYDVFKREMNMQIEGLSFNDYLMPVNQFWSMHITFPQLGSGSGIQPFKTVKDYEDFLKRIDDFVEYMDTCTNNMRRGMAAGVTPPKVLMMKTLPQIQSIIVKDPKESVFYGPIKLFPDSLGAEQKARFDSLYTKAITEKLTPTYEQFYNFVKNEYIPKCRETVGITAIPQGKELYAFLVREWTTTEMTPDQIFEIGQGEVARLRGEMEKIKDQTGFKGDLKAFFNFIHTNKQFMPFKVDSEVINAYRAIETRMQPQLKQLFNLVPKAKFEVRQTEKFREASASAEYNQASPDGVRPGIFYVPVIDAKKYNVVGMEDLFLHEAIPGHHYQTSIQQENDSLPKFRRFGWYGAYGEGWALYTESLGKELGLYTDPYQYFGSLSEEMHRAIRLVVDVGMHTKSWTREQAIQFSLDNEAETEADITAEIERYMAIPGQALAYKIGQMKIIELRKRAEKEMRNKFSIKDFHDQVLKDGCLPLDIFEKKMLTWMNKK